MKYFEDKLLANKWHFFKAKEHVIGEYQFLSL